MGDFVTSNIIDLVTDFILPFSILMCRLISPTCFLPKSLSDWVVFSLGTSSLLWTEEERTANSTLAKARAKSFIFMLSFLFSLVFADGEAHFKPRLLPICKTLFVFQRYPFIPNFKTHLQTVL